MSLNLVTGASGFVGAWLVRALRDRGQSVRAATRRRSPPRDDGVETVVTDVTDPGSLAGVAAGVDTIYHLAGIAHTAPGSGGPSLHRRVTVDGTAALLEEAIRAGVRRLVYFSSVKAVSPSATDAYGRAKQAAEQRLLDAARGGRIEVAVLRPALVYGPGVKGNLGAMLRAVDHRLFPPLPEVHNRRSLVDVRDLVEAAILAGNAPRANGRVYVVTDGQVYSTRTIYELMCRALGRKVPGWTVPLGLLRAVARLGDRLAAKGLSRFPLDTARVEQLLGSAWYDGSAIGVELGFLPAHTLGSAMPDMVRAYRASGKQRP